MRAEYLIPVDPTEQIDPSQIYGRDKFENWDEEQKNPQGRLNKALEMLVTYGSRQPEVHHNNYAIDQMVRALTGCPVTLLRNMSAIPSPIVVASFGESQEYLDFIKQFDNESPKEPWDEGICP